MIVGLANASRQVIHRYRGTRTFQQLPGDRACRGTPHCFIAVERAVQDSAVLCPTGLDRFNQRG